MWPSQKIVSNTKRFKIFPIAFTYKFESYGSQEITQEFHIP